MLASITPLGERSRRQRWGITVTALTVGGAAGGAAVGTLAAMFGSLAHPTANERLGGLAAVVLILVAAELSGRSLSPHRRQVNEQWLRRYRGWVYGAGFGVQLGTGLATTITTTAVYTTFAACLLAPSMQAGFLIGLFFGTVRGLSPLAAAWVHTPEQLAAFHRRFVAFDRPTRLGALACQAAAAIAAIGLLG
jgi:hypothetical protein